jgi:hypothetical protein
MATKTMHLELVRNLTLEAFIAALQSYICRSGLIDHICGDNGNNFVGASTELKALYKSVDFLR